MTPLIHCYKPFHDVKLYYILSDIDADTLFIVYCNMYDVLPPSPFYGYTYAQETVNICLMNLNYYYKFHMK